MSLFRIFARRRNVYLYRACRDYIPSLDTCVSAVLSVCNTCKCCVIIITRMWANAQRDGRPAEYRWSPLFNAAKFA